MMVLLQIRSVFGSGMANVALRRPPGPDATRLKRHVLLPHRMHLGDSPAHLLSLGIACPGASTPCVR